jgi:leucyl aminopeptidase
MPLWDAYDALLDSKVADICNVSSGAFAGSITAALFLRRFVEKTKSWAHFDVYAWTPSPKPGRLLYALIEERFGQTARPLEIAAAGSA